jgi:preprotein translocase subunit SecA
MRIFAGDKVKNLMERMGMPDDEPIEHPWVTKSVENAQKKVEERNFDIRKNLLEYDDVMNAQRKTIYEMRQQLLVGRYLPDVLDDEGKSTGEKRTIKVIPHIADLVKPDVGYLLGMFAADPVMPRDSDGNPRTIERKDFEGITKFVEVDNLQREIYTRWGVKVELEGRDDKVLEIYDELATLMPLALTEQRDRVLDLMDRVLGAMAEESCPPRKPPEDWDWGGIFQGFREHFGVDLPDDVAEFSDPELLAHELFQRAEGMFKKREEEIGLELVLRAFRHLYLEELDKAWVDHLSDMDHLRDGIGLRGYGQKDPKQEYKKEGYNLFVNMVARVSSNVLTKLFSLNVRKPEEEAAIEQADMARHVAELQRSVAGHAPVVTPAGDGLPDPEEEEMAALPAPMVLVDQDCPCGSGKPFNQCHGSGEDEATV